MKLNKQEKKCYEDCRGHCSVCFYDGGCSLQNKLKKDKKAKKGKKGKKKNG